ncbi:MAG TPA: hypothetical protein VLG40_02745 [Candidatus Saccharimonas sp.]|nr:hypothetical protein [Candidatus Saccharimonas sp.]
MQRFRLALLFVRPSVFSFTATLIVAGLIIAGMSWSYFMTMPFVHDYLFGRSGALTVLAKTPDLLSASRTVFFSQPTSYNAFIFVGAVVIGLVVFIVLQLFTRAATDVSSMWREIHQAQGETKKELEQEIELRIGFRAAMVLLWIGYIIVFVKLLLPFIILIEQFGITNFATISGWWYGLLGFGLLAASLHVHIIFMRLMLLRPRVFGGENILVDY